MEPSKKQPDDKTPQAAKRPAPPPKTGAQPKPWFEQAAPATPRQPERPGSGRIGPPAKSPEPPVAVEGARGLVIVGVKPASEPAAEPKKLIESAGSVFKSFVSKLSGEAPKQPPASAPPPPAPPPEADPGATVALDSPAAQADPPPRRVRRGGAAARPAEKHALDRIVLRVGPGLGQKAGSVLVRKGIKDAKVEGDCLEFTFPSNRVSQVFKAMIEAHVELYELERTPLGA